MIHPKTEIKFISEDIGYGVVATEFIPAGTIIWVLDKLDREFTSKQFQSMSLSYKNILDTYTFRNNKGNYVLCWDNGRFINHSFNSNCLTTAYDFEIAIKDIQVGDQLTDDYGYLNIQSPFRGIDEGTKRKIVYPNDLVKYHKIWDKKINQVFHKIAHHSQPLQEFISISTWSKINKIIKDGKKIDSILNNLYTQPS